MNVCMEGCVFYENVPSLNADTLHLLSASTLVSIMDFMLGCGMPLDSINAPGMQVKKRTEPSGPNRTYLQFSFIHTYIV